MTIKTAFPPARDSFALMRRVPGLLWQILGAFVIYAVVSGFILAAHPDAMPQLRFSIEPLLAASIAIQIHVGGALTALVIGMFLLAAPKGMRFHRTLGWTWVFAMAVTAGSSFFITGLMGTSYSPIHALSAWTLIGLPFGIAAIRLRDIRQHRHTMTGMFVGGLIIAGLFSFLPGRLMWSIFVAT
ncbi:MAG: DUF2306 domain-containing protein [Pseudomonadota bacterium]